jgi:hypothetical protein
MDITNSPQIIEHVSQSVNFTPFDAKWVPMRSARGHDRQRPRRRGRAVSRLEFGSLIVAPLLAFVSLQRSLGCGRLPA